MGGKNVINVSEEKGSFTVEATFICVFIMVITMYIVSSVIRINDVIKENGEVEKERFKIEEFDKV